MGHDLDHGHDLAHDGYHKSCMGHMMRTLTMLSLLLLAVVVGGCVAVTAQPQPTIAPPRQLSTERLVDYVVVGRDGEPIGPVDGLVVDTQTGETLYAVVLLKDIYNFGKGAVHAPQDKYLVIPWARLHIQENRQLQVDLTADALAAAPVLYEAPQTLDPTWDASIRRYWAAH